MTLLLKSTSDQRNTAIMSSMIGVRWYESASCEVRYSLNLPPSLRENVREVSKVKAGIKGARHGSKLIEKVCIEADNAGKMLILMPDTKKLELWYNRFGFIRVQSEPVVLMMREPK